MSAVIPPPDERPPLVAQTVEATLRTFVALGIDPLDVVARPVAGKMLTGDIVAWQGAFVPRTGTWYDILFHLTRPGAEHLAKLQSKSAARDDEALLASVHVFLSSIQAMHRRLFETGGPGVSAASTTLFCPPLAAVHPAWAAEVGPADASQAVQLPHIFLACDFHPSPGVARIKPIAGIEPGDVLNEPVSPRGQSLRIPLASRGVVLNADRIAKIAVQMETSQTLWVVEPSLLTRRLHRE